MDEALARLIALISENAAIAGPVIGLFAFAESLVLIGMFVPAIALMIAVGGLIGSGVLDPAPVLFWAILGSVAGDWISYALGRRIGPRVYHRWPLKGHRTAVARARLFFRRYGFVSVFLGRFLGPVRATVPLVAGVMQMDGRAFQIANITSAVVWVPALLAPGYWAGSLGSLGLISMEMLMGLGVALIVLPLVVGWLVSRIMLGRRRAGRARRC